MKGPRRWFPRCSRRAAAPGPRESLLKSARVSQGKSTTGRAQAEAFRGGRRAAPGQCTLRRPGTRLRVFAPEHDTDYRPTRPPAEQDGALCAVPSRAGLWLGRGEPRLAQRPGQPRVPNMRRGLPQRPTPRGGAPHGAVRPAHLPCLPRCRPRVRAELATRVVEAAPRAAPVPRAPTRCRVPVPRAGAQPLYPRRTTPRAASRAAPRAPSPARTLCLHRRRLRCRRRPRGAPPWQRDPRAPSGPRRRGTRAPMGLGRGAPWPGRGRAGLRAPRRKAGVGAWSEDTRGTAGSERTVRTCGQRTERERAGTDRGRRERKARAMMRAREWTVRSMMRECRSSLRCLLFRQTGLPPSLPARRAEAPAPGRRGRCHFTQTRAHAAARVRGRAPFAAPVPGCLLLEQRADLAVPGAA